MILPQIVILAIIPIIIECYIIIEKPKNPADNVEISIWFTFVSVILLLILFILLFYIKFSYILFFLFKLINFIIFGLGTASLVLLYTSDSSDQIIKSLYVVSTIIVSYSLMLSITQNLLTQEKTRSNVMKTLSLKRK